MVNNNFNSFQKDQSRPNLSRSEIIVTSLTSGAVAGAIAKTIIAPLDRTKIIFQTNQELYTTRNAARFLQKIYRTEGFRALWKGNSATLARIMPCAAIQFAAHEQWKSVLSTYNPNCETLNRFVSGALAGITSQTLTYPLDLIRARMAVDKNRICFTLREAFANTYKYEGLLTFYRGYYPTIMGVIPYAGTSFYTYESLKKLYLEKYETNSLSGPAALVFGGIAGICGQTISYPLDIVRRRMQTTDSRTALHKKSVYNALKNIYRNEGIKNGLFKGLSMNWFKGPIAIGISFSTNDHIKMYIRDLAVRMKTDIEE